MAPLIKAFAQIRGNGYFADPVFLVRQSWGCFSAGAHGIATDLMMHAVDCAPDAQTRGRFLYELQGMRIALQDFGIVREVPDPDADLPDEEQAGITLTKGWACDLVAERISEVLTMELVTAAQQSGQEIAPSPNPPIVRSDTGCGVAAAKRLIAMPGCAVIEAADSGTPPALDGPAHERLRAILAGLVLAGAVDSGAGTLILPRTPTSEVPLNRDEALLTAARYGISTVVYDGTPITLEAERRATIMQTRQMCHAHTVGAADELPGGRLPIRFKRYRPPEILNRKEAEVFAAVARPMALSDLPGHLIAIAIAIGLEKNGILMGLPPNSPS